MIDPLVFIQSFIKIRLAAATGPEEATFVRFCIFEIFCFRDAAHQLNVTFQYLVKKFTVLNVVAATSSLLVSISQSWWCIHK